MDGRLGLSLYANAEIGVAVLESFWESRKALIHGEQMAAPRRTDVVHRAMGTVSVERYRVPVYEREAPLDTAGENFQFFAGWSMRLMNRLACFLFDTLSMILTTWMPLSTR
jgi:hypothetical protein